MAAVDVGDAYPAVELASRRRSHWWIEQACYLCCLALPQLLLPETGAMVWSVPYNALIDDGATANIDNQ